MKLYLSADIEGTCGIVNWDETKLECEFSQHYRTQMSKEITAHVMELLNLVYMKYLLKMHMTVVEILIQIFYLKTSKYLEDGPKTH